MDGDGRCGAYSRAVPMNADDVEARRYHLWELTQALIDHVVEYADGPATPETTGAIVAAAAEVEAEAIALQPHLEIEDAEIKRTRRVLESLKNILRVKEPAAALLTDYRTDYYSPN